MRAKLRKVDRQNPDGEILREAGLILQRGGLVAFPTETVYGLGGDALNPKASQKIYAAKGRPSDNPLIVHIARMEDLYPLCEEVPEKALTLAKRFWPGPLTMIFPASEMVPRQTTGGLDTVAVRFPSDKVAQGLILAAGGYVAAPSANTSGRPSPTTAARVAEDLGDAIDMILDGGAADIGLESTIVDFSGEEAVILRPGYISLDMLRETIGEGRLDTGLITEDVRPKAPGMKYRHYAPKADLFVVEGEEKAVVETISRLVMEKEGQGVRCGILSSAEHAPYYGKGEVLLAGHLSCEEEIARGLYENLRLFDERGVSIIYSEAFDTPHMGQAIMNRLLKAAGHKVIKAF
ncbi:MAG: threonylcarbamoyl-AMP synthase [Blautia sp.]|nr:threonylcarbamoyl-AMP synthase [Blautia sp.]